METTKIILRELRLSCRIGIDEAERHCRQTVTVDAEISLRAAPAGDDAPSVDYAAAAEGLRALAARQEFGLMETFARACAELLMKNAEVCAVCVVCCKPKPFADLAAACARVCLQRPQ